MNMKLELNLFDKEQLLDFYIYHLKTVLLPFWLKNSVDREFGGYFTCFDNEGKTLISTDKFTWSQGRMVWIYSKLSVMDVFSSKEKAGFLELAKIGVEFLVKNSILEDGSCTFIMDREGKPKLYQQNCNYHVSTFADCFEIIGLSAYASASGRKELLQVAESIYRTVDNKVKTNLFRTEPDPAPAGYRLHSVPMIMLNTSQELAEAMKELGKVDYAELSDKANFYMYEIMNEFVSEDSILYEAIGPKKERNFDSMMERYICPGHTIEDMWFVIHQALKQGNVLLLEKAVRLIRKALETGWDQEYGGLFHYSDRDGGEVRGALYGLEKEKIIGSIMRDWSDKLWWPHSEALYSVLLAFCLTGDDNMWDWYKRIHDYTFATFPNPDESTGEWIQIRDRKGAPRQKVVALPVKDPFHILRNMILIINLLQRY